MLRQEFLDQLRTALAGELSTGEISEQIEYYNGYINEEVRKGNSEEAVIDSLGDPRLIAKTIIDTKSGSNVKYENYYYEDNAGEKSSSYNGKSRSRGFHASYDNQDGLDVRFGKIKLNTWYFKLLAMIILITLVVTILTIVWQVLAFALPILIPVIIVVVVIGIIGGRRYH